MDAHCLWQAGLRSLCFLSTHSEHDSSLVAILDDQKCCHPGDSPVERGTIVPPRGSKINHASTATNVCSD